MIVPPKWVGYSWQEISRREDVPATIREVVQKLNDSVEQLRYFNPNSGTLGNALPRFVQVVTELHEICLLLEKLFEREMLPPGDAQTAAALRHLSQQLDGLISRVTIGVSQGLSQGITSELVVDKLAEGLYRALVRSTGMKDDVVEGEKK